MSTRFVYIENGEIQLPPRGLPLSWNNISNFNVLPLTDLLELGWYPVHVVWGEKADNEIYIESTWEIESDRVVEYKQVREKTLEELESETESHWATIRFNRNQLLTDSDWTQLNDAPLTTQKRNEWATYRQALRDITNALTPNDVIWPTKPE
jgi:hypothetical protein